MMYYISFTFHNLIKHFIIHFIMFNGIPVIQKYMPKILIWCTYDGTVF
jgi:hypothetical protein